MSSNQAMLGQLRAVLLGDSSNAIHHGCHQLVANWISELERVGIVPLVRHSGPTWMGEPTVRVGLERADLIVINAEGGFHHNRSVADRMIAAAEYGAKFGVPAYIVNCTWQANSPRLADRMRVFRRIYVRETASQRELAQQGIVAHVVPDLTFATKWFPQKQPRHGWLVGDSAMAEVTEKLYRIAKALPQASYLPITSGKWREKPRHLKRRVQWLLAKMLGPLGLCPSRYYSLVVALPDVAAYLKRLGSTCAVLTGRFHTVCFAMLTRTPFIAVPANTHKIEGLVADAGLRAERVIPLHDLTVERARAALEAAAFDDAEEQHLERFLLQAQKAIHEMFADIAADARQVAATK